MEAFVVQWEHKSLGWKKEEEMDSLWLALYWGSPIGLGIFLLCLGGMIYLFTKADEISKRTKAMLKEKGLEKK